MGNFFPLPEEEKSIESELPQSKLPYGSSFSPSSSSFTNLSERSQAENSSSNLESEIVILRSSSISDLDGKCVQVKEENSHWDKIHLSWISQRESESSSSIHETKTTSSSRELASSSSMKDLMAGKRLQDPIPLSTVVNYFHEEWSAEGFDDLDFKFPF